MVFKLKKRALQTITCQQCRLKLKYLDNTLYCQNCNLKYPIKRQLIFMGYDKSNEKDVKLAIAHEKDHQTNLEEFQKHFKFAFPSFKLGALAIKILKNDIKVKKPIVVDVGCGGSPMGIILSDSGFDTYRCELDPNSLYSGLIFDEKNTQSGEYIVCDARILPFADRSVDAVFCKEFVHHVSNHSVFFSEVNRILKKGGVFLLIEPTSRVGSSLKKDHHHGHYYNTIRN